MNTIVEKIYELHKKSLEYVLTGKTPVWHSNRSGLLQMPGIICNKDNSCCQLYKLNFMPKNSFARRTVCSALQLLTELPFSAESGEQLVNSLLWSNSFTSHFAEAFVTTIYEANDLFELGKTKSAQLLIPVGKKVEQFQVKTKLVKEGIVHAYTNSITDLLSQPCLDYWEERYAGIILIE